MTQRLVRLALAGAAAAALAAPLTPASAGPPEECTGTSHRCVEYVKDALCPTICL